MGINFAYLTSSRSTLLAQVGHKLQTDQKRIFINKMVGSPIPRWA